MIIKTAILVDGGFYRKRAQLLFGNKTPSQRAEEMILYCARHYTDKPHSKDEHYLYRIFYYDCYPADFNFYHPLLHTNVDTKSIGQYQWCNDFFDCLKSKRKVALRMGETLESGSGFVLKGKSLEKLCNEEISVSDLTNDDFYLDIKQKGVDMRIGLDIASLATKRLVDQIILIAGDSDFVPVAKHARKEGIDFILDPMWNNIKKSLREHIDGLQTPCEKPKNSTKDPLHVDYKSSK